MNNENNQAKGKRLQPKAEKHFYPGFRITPLCH
jgi:hypothetical protein